MEAKVERLQSHLALLRTCAGWSAASLGERLGVTRQMVSNIENGRKLTRMQYLAIRRVFDEEIKTFPNDTRMLEDVIAALIDTPEKYTKDQRNQILSDANLLAPSIVAKKTSRVKASTVWKTALAGVMIAAVALGAKALLDSKDLDHLD